MRTGFTVEPPNPELGCTPQSVAAHTLYENADPYTLVEPGGSLDTIGAQYHAITDRAVRVEGGRFVPAEKYTVRIEGASLAGYRSIVIAGIRDPLVLRQLDSFLASLKESVERKIAYNLAPPPEAYSLNFRVYGRDGTMGALESDLKIEGHEVGLIIELSGLFASLSR